MGTWGRAVLSDDFARDVYDSFLSSYNSGAGREEISWMLIASHRDAIGDPDDGPVFWLALAKAQWDTGSVDAEVLQRAEVIVSSGEGLERWREAGSRQLAKRQAVLDEFLRAIRTPNPAPRKPKPPRFTKAIFRPGDCLALVLEDGTYGAAIVLAAREGYETYGPNLIATLRYKSPEKPASADFERREWLLLTHRSNDGKPWMAWVTRVKFGKFRQLFEVVGRTELRADDPTDVNCWAGWDLIRRHVFFQFEWEAQQRIGAGVRGEGN